MKNNHHSLCHMLLNNEGIINQIDVRYVLSQTTVKDQKPIIGIPLYWLCLRPEGIKVIEMLLRTTHFSKIRLKQELSKTNELVKKSGLAILQTTDESKSLIEKHCLLEIESKNKIINRLSTEHGLKKKNQYQMHMKMRDLSFDKHSKLLFYSISLSK